jgi:hypothetical protein
MVQYSPDRHSERSEESRLLRLMTREPKHTEHPRGGIEMLRCAQHDNYLSIQDLAYARNIGQWFNIRQIVIPSAGWHFHSAFFYSTLRPEDLASITTAYYTRLYGNCRNLSSFPARRIWSVW